MKNGGKKRRGKIDATKGSFQQLQITHYLKSNMKSNNNLVYTYSLQYHVNLVVRVGDTK